MRLTNPTRAAYPNYLTELEAALWRFPFSDFSDCADLDGVSLRAHSPLCYHYSSWTPAHEKAPPRDTACESAAAARRAAMHDGDADCGADRTESKAARPIEQVQG